MSLSQKILYVMGEPALSIARKRTLEQAGYTVVCVTNGDVGRKMLEHRLIDLVLLDYSPKYSVDTVAVGVKMISPNVPIVVLSSENIFLEGRYRWADALVSHVDGGSLVATVKLLLAA